jgi:hypothetical protein
VRPPSPLNDALNGASVNAELNPELLLSDAAALVANPNLPHLCRGERGCRALLHRHVQVVRRARSEKQMARADTRGIVAMVKHAQAIWNRAIMESVGKDVRLNAPPFFATLHAEDAVTPAPRAALPRPACIGLAHLRPETIFGWHDLSRLSAWLTAILRAAALNEFCSSRERLATVHTLPLRCGRIVRPLLKPCAVVTAKPPVAFFDRGRVGEKSIPTLFTGARYVRFRHTALYHITVCLRSFFQYSDGRS